jgi:hypothetical protein
MYNCDGETNDEYVNDLGLQSKTFGIIQFQISKNLVLWALEFSKCQQF